METNNSCYTSFVIVGEFDPDKISDALGLAYERSWKADDLRRDGKKYGFSLCEFAKCDEYDAYTEVQMRKTLSPFFDKIDALNRIREENDVKFFLNVVPSVYAGGVAPSLAPSLDVIDFLHATRTEIDIDLYVYGENE